MGTDIVPFQGPTPPALVDKNGRPLKREELKRETAGPSLAGVRTIMTGHPAQGLTPERLGLLLRSAEQGNATAYLELAEEMEEKHLHYQAVLGVRKRAVAQLPVTVEAASDDPEDEADAQLVRGWLERDTLQAELFDMLDAIGKGYSATEIMWDTASGPWLPAKLKRQDPRFFEFDKVDGETLRLRGDSGMPEPLFDNKFIVHVAPAKSGIAIRGGVARAVAWAYLFTNYAIKDWVSFLEVYGLPLRVGKYDNGTSEKDINKLADAVAQIGSDAGAVIPKSMLIEFITSGGGATSADMFKQLCDYFDGQISKAVLGQTNTTDAQSGGLGSGQANVHNDVRGDIQRADAVMLAATLNRDLVIPMVTFNRGRRARYPRIVIGRPEADDITTYLAVVEAAVKLNVPVGVSSFRKMTGLAEPKPGDEVLGAAPENPAQGGRRAAPGPVPPKLSGPALLEPLKTALGGSSAPVAGADRGGADAGAREPDAIDRATETAIGDWEPMLETMLTPIDAILASASSLEDVRARLADAIDGMDVSAVREMMARAGFGARIAGMVEKHEA